MKIWISYFYQVRNFEPNMIPFSIAQWDPKWFHNFGDQSKVFIDNKGVINGLRLSELCLPRTAYEHLVEKGQGCEKDCTLQSKVDYQLKQNEIKNDWLKFGCPFMDTYFNHLWNEVDIDKLVEKLEKFCANFKKTYPDLDDPEIVLLVHEAPSNPCGERPVLKRWFAEFGYDLEEWNPYE